jgi:acetyltransferase
MQPPDVHIQLDIRGATVTIRPITPADRDIEAEFVRQLSAQSRYYRFHASLKELTPEQIEQFTRVRFPENMALIATVPVEGREKEIAVARYARLPQHNIAEVAIVVADEWQGLGIGSRMLSELRRIAVGAGIRELYMSVLTENRRMIKLAHQLGFRTERLQDDYTAQRLGKVIAPDRD